MEKRDDDDRMAKAIAAAEKARAEAWAWAILEGVYPYEDPRVEGAYTDTLKRVLEEE